MTQRDIAKVCCVSLGAVKLKKETGSVKAQWKGKYGRKRKTTKMKPFFRVIANFIQEKEVMTFSKI